MNPQRGIVAILAPPNPGHWVECPGVLIGRGLAVVILGESKVYGESVYSITHIGTGRSLAMFDTERIAIECASKMISICSFEQNTVAEVEAEIKP